MSDFELAATEAVLAGLQDHLPVALAAFTATGRAGLVVVDEVNGFATPGAGNLAPPGPDQQAARMIAETDRLARAFVARDLPVAAFLDTHRPGKAEPPYPPHCEAGTGEENLVPALQWLETAPRATLIRKDCINGFVGAIEPATGANRIIDWILTERLTAVLVVGICTDICVMDFVLTLLSARNHGLAPGLDDIVVYERGCATYHLPRETAATLGLPATASHPQDLAHHVGLYFMHARGARLADRVVWAEDSAEAAGG
ncbi:MAG: isochorismatase family protein [Alphaproteobacteria bacterium]|jgi:nicotinamidase-related amidase|nr:isochorismatase family protein [Alphaproteobacteria bacterium]MDP6516317.1 isochorismatase family protein [Alphaproteobacteria bacterium]